MTPMPSTAISTTTLDAGDHGELIAGIPGLVGFPPTDSLVLVTFTATDRLWLGATVRIDLPDHDDEPDAVDLVCTAAVNSGAVATALVVIGGGSADPPATLPHRDLVETIADVLADEQITLTHAAWVPVIEQGTRWWCYADDDCCGEVPDPRTSALAAAAVTAGVVTYASREEMAALFTPDPDDALSRRASLLDELLDTRASPYGERELALDQQLIQAAIDDAAAATGSPELDDRQLVRLAMALANPTIRDDCLVTALGERAAAAERLWTALIRGAPPPERAEPACLLAISAYLRGDGVLAGMAVDVAEEANPGNGLIQPLRTMLDRGLHPVVVRLLLARSIRDAKAAWGE